MSQTYTRRSHSEELAQPSRSAPQSQGMSNSAMISDGKPSASAMGRSVSMPASLRQRMENSFGADFSGVRFFESQQVADNGADAVTLGGGNVGFAPGKLDFSSKQGQELIGHELAHVVSHARGEVTGHGFLGNASLEAQADRQGEMAAAGQSVYTGPVTPLSASTVASAEGPMQAKKKPKISGPTDVKHTDEADVAKQVLDGLTPEKLAAMGDDDRLRLNQWIGGMAARESANKLEEKKNSSYIDKRLVFRGNEQALSNANNLLKKYYQEHLENSGNQNYAEELLGNMADSATMKEQQGKIKPYYGDSSTIEDAYAKSAEILQGDKWSQNLLGHWAKSMDGEDFTDKQRSEIMAQHYLLRVINPHMISLCSGSSERDVKARFGAQNMLRGAGGSYQLNDKTSLNAYNDSLLGVTGRNDQVQQPAAPAPAAVAPAAMGEKTSNQTFGYRSDEIGALAQGNDYDPAAENGDLIGMRKLYDKIKNPGANDSAEDISARKRFFAEQRAAQMDAEYRRQNPPVSPAPAAPKKKWYQFWK